MRQNIPFKITKELEQVGTIIDGLGLPIDEEIKVLVATLRVLGFVTTSSCAGHMDKGTPYVEISSLVTQGFKRQSRVIEVIDLMQKYPGDQAYANEYMELTAKPKQANLEEAWRLQQLLNSFYQTRNVLVDSVLIIKSIGGGLGGYRLESNGAAFVGVIQPQERLDWLKNAQAEMNAFAEFLISQVEQ